MFGINKTPTTVSLEQREKHIATCAARRNGKVVEREVVDDLGNVRWDKETHPSINAAKRAVRASGLKSYTV